MTDDTACVFCDIVRGEAPAHRVYEDEDCLAFLDIRPFTTGHTLVIPKVHARTILDLAPDEAGQVMASATQVARLLSRALEPEGLTLLQANEPAGWQSVFHVHVHVIPRWADDGISPPAPPHRPRVDLARVAERIASAPSP